MVAIGFTFSNATNAKQNCESSRIEIESDFLSCRDSRRFYVYFSLHVTQISISHVLSARLHNYLRHFQLSLTSYILPLRSGRRPPSKTSTIYTYGKTPSLRKLIRNARRHRGLGHPNPTRHPGVACPRGVDESRSRESSFYCILLNALLNGEFSNANS